jgi:hypothetical protein
MNSGVPLPKLETRGGNPLPFSHTAHIAGSARRVSGTATFVGSVGAVSGTLEWAYQGSGRLDLQTFAVVFIDGEERIIGASGGLSGAHGSITFSLIGEGPATYEGIIVL